MTDGVTLEQIQRAYERPAYIQQQQAGADKTIDQSAFIVRRAALSDSALSISIKAGMAYQLNIINNAINKNERRLDTIYDFGQLMINNNIVPPVIIEARDLYNQGDSLTIRLSGEYYHIERQARFSSRPPSWREYLTFEIPKVDQQSLFDRLLPRDEMERQLWEQVAQDGWNQGIEQANIIFISSFDRLNRDFIGILKYRTFVLEGKVSVPMVSSASLPIFNDGQTMILNETLLRISTLPTFNSDVDKWIAVPIPSAESDPLITIPTDLEP